LASPQQAPAPSSYDAVGEASSEGAYSPQLRSQLEQLREATLKSDYAWNQVAYLTDNIGPRPAGSLQAEGAVNHLASELRSLGLEVRLEPVQVPQWQRGPESAELVNYPGQVTGTTQKIVLTALGGNTPTPPGGLTAEVVVVSGWDQLQALGREKVAGKVVLFNNRFDSKKAANGFAFPAYEEAVAYRVAGAAAAAKLGAVAMLVRSVGNADFRLPHTGYSSPAGIPSGAVTSEDASLIAHLASEGTVRVHLILASKTGPPVASHNVVADLKGSEHPEQIVLISGHLDSWDLGTGAIDDAAGVVAALGTVEALERLHLRPKRTIRFVAWMDEENGGSGSRAYAVAHAGEIAAHVAAIESDSGAGHPLGFEAKLNPAALPLLRPIANILSGIGANLLNLTNSSPEADIEPLSQAGVPAFGLLQDGRAYFNYHHTAADTLDKIVPAELQENVAAMAVMAYALAELADPLPR
jgi:Zn-dependent M28 family amino/carboxypeptidase